MITEEFNNTHIKFVTLLAILLVCETYECI